MPSALVPSAAPLKLALASRNTTTASVPPFQPETLPSSVTKRNRAAWPFGRTKPLVPLKTVPVGVPCPFPVRAGIRTTRVWMPPAPL